MRGSRVLHWPTAQHRHRPDLRQAQSEDTPVLCLHDERGQPAGDLLRMAPDEPLLTGFQDSSLVERAAMPALQVHTAGHNAAHDVQRYLLRGWLWDGHGAIRLHGLRAEGLPLWHAGAQCLHDVPRCTGADHDERRAATAAEVVRRAVRAEGRVGCRPDGICGRLPRWPAVRRLAPLHRPTHLGGRYDDEPGAHGDGLPGAAQGGHGPTLRGAESCGDCGQVRGTLGGRVRHEPHLAGPHALLGLPGSRRHCDAWRLHGLVCAAEGPAVGR
mmetsp:Transcript_28047/g.89130  ORF Transcript_28047/g.89130 Transcript_28047/m.89130 type:complete len:271 (-) Transcript_28047:289-1101(-)